MGAPQLDYSLTLAELSHCCGVTAEQILVLVGEGIVTPQGRAQCDWRFDALDLVRARSAIRLQSDLGVNVAGAALAIELIEEAQRLREQVRLLEGLVFGD